MTNLTNFFEHLRFLGFWGIDAVKGAKIKSHLNNISVVLDRYTSDQAVMFRKKQLEKIKRHAINTTSFYKNHRLSDDFPVINKNHIRARQQEFESQLYHNKKVKIVSTSGSTSSALKVKQNLNKVLRSTADSIYFGRQAGYKIGYRLLYLRHWDDNLRKTWLTKHLQNVKELEVVSLTDNYIKKTLKTLKKGQSRRCWLGYPSGYELICKYLDKTKSNPISCNIQSIITMSEGVNGYTKKAMEKYFNCPVVSRYSNSENGIIAQQKKYNNSYTINWASFHVEIFKIDKDEPAKTGDLGRIVVTDLYNYATPFIRYDTGDLGAIDYSQFPPVLKKVEGRQTDVIYNTKGEVISSFIITNIVEYKGVIQGQLIQEQQKVYRLKLNTTEAFNDEEAVLLEFKGYLGSDADIKIEYVNEIPLLASGKRKATINNYLTTKSNKINA